MDIQTLKKSLCNVNQCDSGIFLLEEKDRSATLKKVSLCDVPKGALVVRMDNKVGFHHFLKDQKSWGFNKHSDYLVITQDKLVFIELKSKKEVGQGLTDECQQKFASDGCTLYYADKIFEMLLHKNSFFDNREPHYVLLFQAPSIAKTSTSVETMSPNTTPDNFRPIPVSNEGTISFFKTI